MVGLTCEIGECVDNDTKDEIEDDDDDENEEVVNNAEVEGGRTYL